MQKITDEDLFEDFIDNNSCGEDLFYDMDKYTEQIKEMALRIFLCCYRFNLYKEQIKFVLNEALKPFNEKKPFIGGIPW